MKYNQPFGIPDPNASYVNGDPSIGREGSIPPAESIEYPQREIVAVIQYAYEQQFPNCNAPANSDLAQLLEAILGFLAQRYINTPITKTVHGAGADFANLHDAIEWVGRYIITPLGSVTFLIAAGKWTYSERIVVTHPNADRITIAGQALLGAAPGPSTFTVTGHHSASDGTADINALRAIFATELSFLGTDGFYVVSAGITLSRLLITGTQTGIGGQGFGVRVEGRCNFDTVSIWGMGAAGLWCNGGYCYVTTGQALCLVYNIGHGLKHDGGIVAHAGNLCTYSNGQCGVAMGNGGVLSNSPSNQSAALYSRGNASTGVNCESSTVLAEGPGSATASSVISDNGGNGVGFTGDSAHLGGATINNNVGYGIYGAAGNISLASRTATIAGNGQNGLEAHYGCNIYAADAGVTGPVYPPYNTYNMADGGYIGHV